VTGELALPIRFRTTLGNAKTSHAKGTVNMVKVEEIAVITTSAMARFCQDI